METLVKSCNICWGCSCQTSGKNKVPISLGRVELFCLFVARSYTSMETAVLSYHFSWVWFSIPKVI